MLWLVFPSLVYVIISTLLWLAILFYIYPALIYKRQHDRNNDGKSKVKWVWIIFGASYLLSLISSIVTMITLPSIQTEAQQLVDQLQTATTTGEQEKISQDILALQQKAAAQVFTPSYIGLAIAMIICSIWSLVLIRPLLFAKGTAWHNSYGADPLEKKKK